MSIVDRLVLFLFASMVVGPMAFYYLKNNRESSRGNHLLGMSSYRAAKSTGSNDSSQLLPFQFREDDQEINDAIAEANESVDEFIDALRAKKFGQSSFSVCSKVGEANEAGVLSHVWLVPPVKIEKDIFFGKIGNRTGIENMGLGDLLAVPKKDITDWLYIDNGKLVGGFTYQVARRRLPTRLQNALDEEMATTLAE